MKKVYISLLLVLMCLFLASCKKKEKGPDFSDEMFVKLSYTPVNISSEEYTFTINIEVYQDAKAYIYADDFVKWYGEAEPEKVLVNLTDDDISGIKKCIVDNKIYELQRDVGNKDNIEGVRKSITIYTKDDEFNVSGLHPSNRQFNKVYDMISDLVRTELTGYMDDIENIQKAGKENDVGIYITDENDSIVFEKANIKEIYAEDAYIMQATETDADIASDSDSIYEKRIVFELNDEVLELYEDMTFYLNPEDFIVLKLYNDKIFVMTLMAYNENDNIKLYSSNIYYDADSLEEILAELKEGLD